MADRGPTFSARLARRAWLWWGGAGVLGYRPGAPHRLLEWYTFRGRNDPDALWRCCAYWPRRLLNKWNAREFAARHGCALPSLYWRGLPGRVPFERLPPHFVIRPVRGTARRGVYVVSEGRELLRDETASPRELRARVRRPRLRAWTVPVLAEEFVRSEAGEYRLPLEYKCHVFGGSVAAVQVIERAGIDPHAAVQRYYTPAWDPIPDPMDVAVGQAPPRDPPACLAEMLRLAEALGAALGVYMRIDFFATDRGCVFNEFSSVPRGGRHQTPYCDALFGALWAQRLGDAV